MFRGLVGSKALTKDAVQPALDKMKDHLIGNLMHIKLLVKLFSCAWRFSSIRKLQSKVDIYSVFIFRRVPLLGGHSKHAPVVLSTRTRVRTEVL